jgi:hypothetical protein
MFSKTKTVLLFLLIGAAVTGKVFNSFNPSFRSSFGSNTYFKYCRVMKGSKPSCHAKSTELDDYSNKYYYFLTLDASNGFCNLSWVSLLVEEKLQTGSSFIRAISDHGTTTLSIMTFSIMTFSIMTFSIMTFSITTFSITTFNIKETHHNNALTLC